MENQQPTTNNQQPITILVTGANGQLGKSIQELDSQNEYDLDFTFATKAELDIANAASLEQFFKNKKFDYCINCAAYTNVEQAEKTPKIAFQVNAEGVKNLAEYCKSAKTVLIHISTDYVFDGMKGEPYTVYDRPNPINEYGKSKLLGEQYIQEGLKEFFIIRTSWLYSKKYGKNFYRTILEKAKTETELFVTDEQLGCPTNTEDLANYVIQHISLGNKDYGIHHYNNSKAMTWYDFAKQILEENNLLKNIKLKATSGYKTVAKRPKYSALI